MPQVLDAREGAALGSRHGHDPQPGPESRSADGRSWPVRLAHTARPLDLPFPPRGSLEAPGKLAAWVERGLGVGVGGGGCGRPGCKRLMPPPWPRRSDRARGTASPCPAQSGAVLPTPAAPRPVPRLEVLVAGLGGRSAHHGAAHSRVKGPPPQGGRMEEPPGPGREGAAVPRAWAACRLAGTHPVKTRHSSVQKRMSTWLNMADCVRRMARWKSFCGRGHRWRQRRGRDGAQSPSRRHVPDWCA